ncbi:MAG: GNAT family N-acetyltransferase [Candidatus Bathyarchaeota archaeon]|nr:GNAT family N-acetyltransferase [Candidatus Bathyarchaeota archaeon]
MSLLAPEHYNKLMSLGASLNYHLTLRSIIQGKTSASVYVDRVQKPQAAFLWRKEKAWLLGSPVDTFTEDLLDTLEGGYFQILREHGADRFRLHYDEMWGSVLDRVFLGLKREEYPRSYYHMDAGGKKWDVNLPPGFRVVEIDEALFASEHGNLDRVRDETVSERDSVEDFLESSFGYVAMEGDEIVSWCMSEYNMGDRCELGIATIERHQRKGLATQVARAVIGHAVRQGVHGIGWHCWKNNEPSVRTALKIGFKHGLDYSICQVKIDDN